MELAPTRITLDRAALAACAVVSRRNKTRARNPVYGVRVEPQKGRYIATTGEIMFICLGAGPAAARCEPFTLPQSVVEALLHDVPGSIEITLQIEDDDTVSASPDGARWWWRGQIDQAYPNYRRAIPTGTSGKAAHYNPELISCLAKAGQTFNAMRFPGRAGRARKTIVPTLSQNEDKAAIMDWGCEGMFGAIMPMRAAEPRGKGWADIVNAVLA